MESAIVSPTSAIEPITVQIWREMINNAEQIAPEVKQAWLAALVP
jgi:hypothetical protein